MVWYATLPPIWRCSMLLALSLMLAAPPAPICPLRQAQHTVDRLAASISGRVGAAMLVIESGCTIAAYGNERFPMQSVYKVPIAMAVLQQIDAGKLRLSQIVHLKKSDMVPSVHSPIRDQYPAGTDLTVRELLRGAVVESDGTASDMLLHLASPADVTRMAHHLGSDSMVLAATERGMVANASVQYRNWTTPHSAVALLRALQRGRGVSAPSRVLLLGWMTETTIGAKRIPGLLPAGTAVAHKTGTDATRNGLTRATNDIGIVTLPNGQHLAVAVFIRDSKATTAEREAVIARIARAAWDVMTRKNRK